MKRTVSILPIFVVALFSGSVSFLPIKSYAGYEAPSEVIGSGNVMESLSVLNRIKPLQNPLFKKSEAILNRTVIDRENRIVGEVENVLIGPEGKASAMLVSFDRLRLQEPVFLSYKTTSITPSSNGYKVGFDGKEIEAMYPELLAQIETAAGGSEIISLRDVIGKPVLNDANKQIGDITDVLFDEKGARALAFYVTMQVGENRGKGVAVPYDIIAFESGSKGLQGKMAQSDIDLLPKFAKTER